MANVNGAVNLKLGETEYVLLPKWKAISELENQRNDGVLEIARQIQSMSPNAITMVLLAALKHNGYTEFTKDSLGEYFESGKLKYAQNIASAWLMAFLVAPDDVKAKEGEAAPAAV